MVGVAVSASKMLEDGISLPVVGVVGDAHNFNLAQPPPPQLYTSLLNASFQGNRYRVADYLRGQVIDSIVFMDDGRLLALADTRVFFKKEIDLSSMEGILKAAIEAEKDSIVFYLGMKEAVPPELGHERLDGIIKEEMGHIRMLSNRLVSMNP